jgi:uncharacterized protein YbjQ (UPF0145 family)
MKTIAFSVLAGLIFLTGCATCTHHITGRERPAVSPEAVYVYPVMPRHAEMIASISASSYAGITLKQANDDALNHLKAEAAKLGANGIVLRGTNDAELAGANVRASAFYVAAADLSNPKNLSAQDAGLQY